MTQDLSAALVTKFQPILDEIYKLNSLTARMDSLSKPIDFAGANTVKIFKTTMGGLGNFARGADYPAGEIAGSWEALTLAASRARQLKVARMDDEETLGMAFGTVAGEFLRTKVIPEVDAYRFAKYASTSSIGTTTGATLSSSTVLAALDVGKAAIRAAECPLNECLLFVSDVVQGYLEAAVTRMLGNDNTVNRLVTILDSMPVITVPQTRFYTIIDLEAGATAAAAGHYSKNASGKDINFMIIHPPAVIQVKKQELTKIFSPDEVQNSDNWLFDYSIYHDAFVLDNKVSGVYLHKKA
jgi:hypothetical protein